ncbi:hypothetical protein B6U98_02350 [Thermoplasmatales archaeon ex4572_165]|nr:MAG: hypothetical protein B6U98_02350 [Thermoplasmatales archaeon ex4572_165]
MFIQTLSGNTSDKEHFRILAKTYAASVQKVWSDERIWVWDSAFYTKKNLQSVPTGLRWISRVPETVLDAKELISAIKTDDLNESTSFIGYHLFSTKMMYAGIQQRWILVFSEKAYAREMKTLEKRIHREKERLEKKLWHPSKQGFNCKKDALQGVGTLQKKWQYHMIGASGICSCRTETSYEFSAGS